MKTPRPFDFWIFLCVLMLLSLGIIMVFSASAPTAYNTFHDTYYIMKQQLIYAAIGLAGMLVASNIDYHKWQKIATLVLIISLVLIVLVLIPGIGREIKDTWRWIYIGPIHFQPSEIVKFALILFFASSLSKRKDQLKYFFKGMFPYLLLIGIISGLLLLEPHMSCTIIIIAVGAIILFVAGAKVTHFLILGVPAVLGLSTVIIFVDYMRKRVLSFLNPWSDPRGDGWQAIQSLYAIGSGGLFGRGLGRSMQKFLYLPEPHNDFIFSVLAEELGFIGVLAVMLLFMILIWRGLMVSVNAPDTFGSLLAAGIISLIAVQSLLNVAVVTSSIPPTGVSLPFFSYGGTSLALFMGEIGIVLNISKHASTR